MNKNLDYIFSILSSKKISSYYLPLANEHLYEFTKFKFNYLYELCGFTGDTGSIFLYNNEAYLFVDGRFTIQAKNEINDKRIKVIEINSDSDKIDFIISKLKSNKSILLNPKLISIDRIITKKEILDKYNIKIIFSEKHFNNFFKELKKNCFYLSSAPLFILDKKYVGDSPKKKISKLLNDIKLKCFIDKNASYVTSNLEEIAYLTNIRFEFCDIGDESILFDSYMIVNNKQSILYIKDYLCEKDINYLKRNNIIIKDIKCFYSDMKILNHSVYIDAKINNYFIYKCLKKIVIIHSPLLISRSIKNPVEVINLRKCNLVDGVSMVKILYGLKHNFKNSIKNEFKTEYDIKMYVDKIRKTNGKKKFLCNSFETIVAYKENSAICHYTPKEKKSKRVFANSLLLIDSGGNYLTGTTDITRTISLYKDTFCY